jgi:hypothetical protein
MTLPELWTCPSCGKGYLTRNMSHSCTRVVHVFEIRSVDDIDEVLMELLREGRAVGDQKHLMTT